MIRSELNLMELDEKYSTLIKERCHTDRDRENSHWVADELLCELLLDLGMDKTVDEFKALTKWYA